MSWRKSKQGKRVERAAEAAAMEEQLFSLEQAQQGRITGKLTMHISGRSASQVERSTGASGEFKDQQGASLAWGRRTFAEEVLRTVRLPVHVPWPGPWVCGETGRSETTRKGTAGLHQPGVAPHTTESELSLCPLFPTVAIHRHRVALPFSDCTMSCRAHSAHQSGRGQTLAREQ